MFRSQEEKIRWQRKRNERLRLIAEESAARSSDWRAIHGEGVEEPGRKWTNSTRYDINEYGRGSAHIRDVGVIKKRP